MESSRDEKKINTENQNPSAIENSEELKFEPEITDIGEYSSEQKDLVAELRKKLKKCDEEKKEYLSGWQRAKADYINSKKQDEQDNELMVKFAEARLLSELIPVLDSFEIAFANKEETAKLQEEWGKGV